MLDLADRTLAVPGEGMTVGPFAMRFFHVTHSIPDGMAVAIDTPHGTLLHTGDFKLDPTPIDGRPTDLHGIAEEAGRGVHLLLSDSTNAEEQGHSASERTVGPVVRDIIEQAPAIVVVACFSSHIHRIQQVVDAAIADDRVVCILGRSMQNSVRAARELGILRARRPGSDRDRGGRCARPRARGDRLHRLAGRAVQRPQPDGRPGAQVGEAEGGRHRGAVLELDPGERARDPPGGRRALPERRGRLPRPRRRGACDGSRVAGGAPAHALVGEASLVRAGPRGTPPPAAPWEAGGGGRDRARSRAHLGGRRRAPDRPTPSRRWIGSKPG